MRSTLYDREVWALGDVGPLDAPPCPVCDGRRATPRFGVAEATSNIIVCNDCRLGRFHPLPAAEEIASFYPDEYYGPPGHKFSGLVERLVQLVGSRHVRFLSRGLRPGARVLDVGCGRGVFLGALADRGFEVHGIDTSESATSGADSRASIRIVPDLSHAAYPNGFFDEVIIWHVLEHLADPVATLIEIRRILRPEGRLVVAVPNFASLQARWAGPDWFHLDPPRHLYHFPVAALRRLLQRAGFAPRSTHHFSLRQNPFGWVQSALNRSARLPRNGLYVLLHRRDPAEPPPFSAATRLRLRLAYLVGMPLALGLTVLTTWLRSGATVHVVATLDGEPASDA